MASVQKRGKKYAVVYDYIDENGKKKQKWESFSTFNEANRRKTTIDKEKQDGTFVPPSSQTVSDFLQVFVELYGTKKWAPSTYTRSCSIIQNYIDPYMGKVKVQDVNPIYIERYYAKLLNTPTVSHKYHKSDDTVSTGTIKNVHKLLRCAFGVAVKWGIIASNPFEKVDPPKHVYKKREIWTSDMIIKALEVCDDPKLSISIHLSFACSLRLGEVLGLRWQDVHITDEDIENDNAYIDVTCELTTAKTEALKILNYKDIIFEFPHFLDKGSHATVKVLKKPKTDSSIRRIWLPKTLAWILRKWKEEQDKYKEFFGDDYSDFDLVVCYENGRPCSHNTIRSSLNRVTKEAGLPKVVFHSFRHTSTTYKLKLNHGDIKATQGDTGHSQADMITEVYGHILDEDRKVNAQRFNETFYMNSGIDVDHQEEKKTVDIEALVKELSKNPELMSQLIDALK